MSICNIKCQLILAKSIWQGKNFSASPYNITVMTMVLSNQYISRRAYIKSTNNKFQWYCFKSPEWHSWICHPTNKSLGKIDAIKCTDHVSGPSKIRFVAICSITSFIPLQSHTKRDGGLSSLGVYPLKLQSIWLPRFCFWSMYVRKWKLHSCLRQFKNRGQ